MPTSYDYILVGGGLQSSLILLALAHRSPNVRIALIERDLRIGGNHTWSFHATDVPKESAPWFDPLVSYRWPRYEVRFPNRRRTVEIGYASILSHRLHDAVIQRAESLPNIELFLGQQVTSTETNHVLLQDGRRLDAAVVIDARGPVNVTRGCGYQKFVGLEVELVEPMKNPCPIAMDALVPQQDGFRFLYVLPFTPTRCLFEETYFSDGPAMDLPQIRDQIKQYITVSGYRIADVVREESGVLPMPWRLDLVYANEPGPLRAGYRGGWFHPATGYSLPVAIRLANYLARTCPTPPSGQEWSSFVKSHQRQARFASVLNALLFRTFPPDARWNIFERFYGFPEESISRFYALDMQMSDRARLLCGRPPRGMSLRQLWR